jgi:hypothetical protein
MSNTSLMKKLRQHVTLILKLKPEAIIDRRKEKVGSET